MAKLHTVIPLLAALALVLATVTTYGIVNSQSGNGKYDSDGDGLIEIEYLEQLDAIRYDLNGDGRPDDDVGMNAYAAAFPVADGERLCRRNCDGYELARSLDFNSMNSYRSGKVNAKWTTDSGWLPLGFEDRRYQATFNGNGYTIANLYINRNSPLVGERDAGLFGYLDSQSTIMATGIVDAEVNGAVYVGLLAGRNAGTIVDTFAVGECVGRRFIGGLIGVNNGTVTTSYSVINCDGQSFVGGLTGWNSGQIIASYSTGSVSGDVQSGGLVGGNYFSETRRDGGAIITSYSTSKVSGKSSLGGLIPDPPKEWGLKVC